MASERAVGMGAENRSACEILFDDEEHDCPTQNHAPRSAARTFETPFEHRRGEGRVAHPDERVSAHSLCVECGGESV